MAGDLCILKLIKPHVSKNIIFKKQDICQIFHDQQMNSCFWYYTTYKKTMQYATAYTQQQPQCGYLKHLSGE